MFVRQLKTFTNLSIIVIILLPQSIILIDDVWDVRDFIFYKDSIRYEIPKKLFLKNDQPYNIHLDTIYQCMETQNTIYSYLIISWINPNCPGHAKIWYFDRCLSGNQNIPCCQISMYKFFLLQISHALEKWCVVERKCTQIHNFVPNRYLQLDGEKQPYNSDHIFHYINLIFTSRTWNSSRLLAIFWLICPIWPGKSNLLGQIYCTFPMGNQRVHCNVPALKEWPTYFKLLFQALTSKET